MARLTELGLKAGDVVVMTKGPDDIVGEKYTAKISEKGGTWRGKIWVERESGKWISMGHPHNWQFELVKRAEPTYKKWGDMSDEEKGALLLAQHKGKTIQSTLEPHFWHDSNFGHWANHVYYRVKPEPKRETVTLYGCGLLWSSKGFDGQKHIIVFETIDGKPDWSTLKGEDL